MRLARKILQPVLVAWRTFGRLMHFIATLVPTALVVCAMSGAAFADDPPGTIYWISMRGITEDAQPSFVRVSRIIEDGRTQAIQGCDGRTYYMTSGDYATYQAAVSAGDTVQLHAGAQPAVSQIECMVQADQG